MSYAVCETCMRSIHWVSSRGTRLNEQSCPHCHGPLRSSVSYGIRRMHGGRRFSLHGRVIREGDRIEYLRLDTPDASWRAGVVAAAKYNLFITDLENGARQDHCAARWPGMPAPIRTRQHRAAPEPVDGMPRAYVAPALDVIEHRAKAASSNPDDARGCLGLSSTRDGSGVRLYTLTVGMGLGVATLDDEVNTNARCDADLFAHARSDILSLVAYARRLAEQVQALERRLPPGALKG